MRRTQDKVVCLGPWLFTWRGALSSIRSINTAAFVFPHGSITEHRSRNSKHVGFEANSSQVDSHGISLSDDAFHFPVLAALWEVSLNSLPTFFFFFGQDASLLSCQHNFLGQCMRLNMKNKSPLKLDPRVTIRGVPKY